MRHHLVHTSGSTPSLSYSVLGLFGNGLGALNCYSKLLNDDDTKSFDLKVRWKTDPMSFSEEALRKEF